MKKKLLPIITIVAMLFLGACSNEDIVQDAANNTPDSSRVLSFTASMPSKPTPRVALEENADKSIDLAWEEGDEIKFAFVQGETTANATSTVTNISNGGKSAQFAIVLPVGINNTDPFTLHGVYGGGELSGTNLILPKGPNTVKTLDDIDMVLTFKQELTSLSDVSVSFKHIGSLFNISLKNSSSTSLDDLLDIRFVGTESDNKNWAFNAYSGEQIYDISDGSIEGGGGNQINFAALKAKESLAVDETVTLWGWYPLLGNGWPSFELRVTNTENKLIANSLEVAKKTPVVGRNYSFYVMWDGAAFQLTDETLAPPVASLEVTVKVPTMGGLEAALSSYDLNDIDKLTLTGQINATDFEFMKTQLPNMTYLDMQTVTCDKNEIPRNAFGRNSGTAYSAPHSNLTTVIFPKSVTTMGREAFAKCPKLTTVVLNEGLEEIGYLAFKDTDITGEVKIPSTVTKIAGFAFNNCPGITSVVLNDVLTGIASDAFKDCTGIRGTVIFPSTMNSIAHSIFDGCDPSLRYRILREIVAGYPDLSVANSKHPFPEGATIEVPEILLGNYNNYPSNWGTYADQRYNFVAVPGTEI